MGAVNMSGEELKSSEKRAADAALEKENMRVAMTATEQKAISTTYVDAQNPLLILTQCHPEQKRPHTSPSAAKRVGAVWGLSCV